MIYRIPILYVSEPYIKTLLAKVQPSIETEREEHSEGNEDTIDYYFFDVSMASLQINESQILETSLQSLGAALSELDVSIESVEDDLFEIKLQSFEEVSLKTLFQIQQKIVKKCKKKIINRKTCKQVNCLVSRKSYLDTFIHKSKVTKIPNS